MVAKMIHLATRITAVVMCLALAGCTFKLPPIVTVEVAFHGQGLPVHKHTLSNDRIKALSAWFSGHPSGWSVSHASHVPALEARAKHADGGETVINVLPKLVVAYNPSGQFTRPLSASELSALEEILKTTPSPATSTP